ncbi:guanidinoacetate N-methyltransferase [Paxillus involutus ATCC 200175]|nr:guanidinoacetate N-methyltransferase [Paxillus involutus ATCC 200175]
MSDHPEDPEAYAQDDIEIFEDVEDMEEINAFTELGITLIQAILEKEPMENIRDLIDAGAPLWFQDNEGTSPLHAAAYVGSDQMVKLLVEEGAVWNAVDNLGNTAGDIALSMNNEACYTLIRDAGIRSELLLALVSSGSSLTETPSSLVIRDKDTSAVGSTDAFLASRLHYTKDASGQDICLLKLEDGGQVGVMMGWERDIMHKTVDELCLSHPKFDGGLKVLNVGFGLGIIDGMFQTLPKPPSLHVIIEPHPDVLAHIKEQGWHEKVGVKILEGKWQDVLSTEEFRGLGKFDVVYTDTFAEHYDELHKFFKRLPDLLDGPDARFSFFNGLAATNALFYDVYTRVCDCHLSEIGAEVHWCDVEVEVDDAKDQERWGDTRKYFTQPIYRLPVAQLKQKD